MFRRSVSLLLLIISFQCFGQKQGQALIDSLTSCLPKTTNDTLKVRLYKRIAEEYFFVDVNHALTFSRLGLKQAVRMKWQRGIGVFYNYLARGYGDKGAYDSCMYYNRKALAIQQSLNDFVNVTSTLNNMGAAEQNLASNYPAAIRYYLLSLKEAEKLDDVYQSANANDNISQIYLGQKNYHKALDYAFKALELRKTLKDTIHIIAARELGNSMSSLGGIYVEMKDSARAGSYYLEAVRLHKKAGNKEGQAKTYTSLAGVSGRDLNKKLEYSLLAKKLWDEVNPSQIEAIHNLGNLGTWYLEMYKSGALPKGVSSTKQLLSLSEKHLSDAIGLSKKNGNVDFKNYFTGVLAELQAEKGDYRNAYLNFRTFQLAQDSIFSQESKNQIAALEGERALALRDKQIELNKLALETQRKQQWGLLAGLALLAIIGLLLYRQSRIRKRTNVQLMRLNNELDEANQIKARLFAIISHDLRSPIANLINFLNLQKEAPDLMTVQTADAHRQRIGDSAETLLETMESMLLWSKSQMQQFRPTARPVQVSDLFDYINKFFAGTPGVTFSLEDAGTVMLVTDDDYLKTIMQNLTNNAVKALKNTPEALIRWEVAQENNQLILSLSDNGPGVGVQELSALYSDDASIGVKTGLGLHLVRDLAKAIACTITVESEKGSGTVFKLIFSEPVV